MFKNAFGFVFLLVSTQSYASGFLCKSDADQLGIRIYNHVSPEKGTSRAAIMVISDLTIKSSNSTVAVFKDTKNTLQGGHNLYIAKVDLRTKELKKGEYLLNTRLGKLSHVFVRLKFNQKNPVKNGEYVSGHLVAMKRSGGYASTQLNCRRYLKL